MTTVDKKTRFIARIFGVAFSVFLYKLLFVGSLSYNSMGHEVTVTAASNPIKFYFGIVWCSVMLLICIYFGLIKKLKKDNENS